MPWSTEPFVFFFQKVINHQGVFRATFRPWVELAPISGRDQTIMQMYGDFFGEFFRSFLVHWAGVISNNPWFGITTFNVPLRITGPSYELVLRGQDT